MSTHKYNWRCTILLSYLMSNIRNDAQDMHENEITKVTIF